MDCYLIAYDLGTGGNKASLYDSEGNCIAETFESYPTFYPKSGWHEQAPEDWWQAVILSTQNLIQISGISPKKIVGIGISGHSLGVVPVDSNGILLRNRTPIWSDSRSNKEAGLFFEQISPEKWYKITGNGFPAPLYSVFKIMWYKKHDPEMFKKIHKVIGTKDYINFKLTGYLGTDFSYASGSGVYDLLAGAYHPDLLTASELSPSLFPEIVASTEIIGNLLPSIADELGLVSGIPVVSGGVDNSCMALGARNTKSGRVYNSQGSSSWIAVTSEKPLIDYKIKPFVFAHVIPGLFTSAVSTFAAGSSLRWIKDQLCRDLIEKAEREKVDVYDLLMDEASKSPAGSNSVIFNPNMAGGTSMSPSLNLRGAFLGLDLAHTRSDLIRAAMEGIAFELKLALDALRDMTQFGNEILVVGGGSRSNLWRQIYADIYNVKIVKTNIDQQAAALGAAACAAVGVGMWKNFDMVDRIHKIEYINEPDPTNRQKYDQILSIFKIANFHLADLGDQIESLNID